MGTPRKKKSRFYRNLNYRFYCRNGTLPIKEEPVEDPSTGRKWKRSYAVLKVQTTNYFRGKYSDQLKYLYNSEFDFLEDVKNKFPNLDSYTEGDKIHLYREVVEGRLSWDDPTVKRVVSYLLSKKFWECKSSEAPYSLTPVYIRDYQRELFARRNTTDYEKELLLRLSKEANPFYRHHELLEVEIPLKYCTVEDGKIKYFTIAQVDENNRPVPYYLDYKKDGKKKRIRITGGDVIRSLRESFEAYLRGNIKAQKGDLFYDYTRIIPIGNNRDLHAVGVDGLAYRDEDAYASLQMAQAEIDDPVLRDNLEFNWQGIVMDCKEWLSKRSKADLAAKLGDFNKIYVAPLSSSKFYPTPLMSLSSPRMINGSYDKLNYNLFMLETSFEYYGKGQIEIDENQSLIFVHYEKEDIKNLYGDEMVRELRRETKYGTMLSRAQSVPVIRQVDEYQGRSLNNVHLKPHEYGYKDSTIGAITGLGDDKKFILARLKQFKEIIGEDSIYLVPPLSSELMLLMTLNKEGTISEQEKLKMNALIRDYYDDILEEREKEHYWYVDLSKIDEYSDFDHLDYATRGLVETLMYDDDFFVVDDTIYSDVPDDAEYTKPKRLYRIVDENALKVLKDTIYRKHMLHAEGRYPLKSELEPKTTKKKKS